MRFQSEFARFHAAIEAGLPEAAKGLNGYESVQAADDALRMLEDRMNEMERALVAIYQAIRNART